MKIAFLGLGKMGLGIAANLRKAEPDIVVYNRTKEKADDFVKSGGKAASSVAEACRDRDIVFSMFSTEDAIKEVAFGSDGILASLPQGSLHVGLGTSSLALTRELLKQHEQHGQQYVSLPVMGRPDAARDAKLILIAGGKEEAIEKLQPLFSFIGKKVIRAGAEPWQASLFKVCTNFTIASMIETYAEAFTAVTKAQADTKAFHELLTEFWGSAFYTSYAGLISARSYQKPGATVSIGTKDTGLMLAAAEELGVSMPVAIPVHNQLKNAVAAGMQDLDWTAVTELSMAAAGLDQKGIS